MGRKYLVNYDLSELERRLRTIIDVNKADDFGTHLSQIFSFKDEGRVSGTIKNQSFKIWTHEQGRSGATGIFYPVVVGQARPSNRGLEIEIKSRMNIIGRTIFYLILIGIGYGITTGIIIQEDNDIRFLIPRFLIGALIFTAFMVLPTFIQRTTTKVIRDHLIKVLGLRTNK